MPAGPVAQSAPHLPPPASSLSLAELFRIAFASWVHPGRVFRAIPTLPAPRLAVLLPVLVAGGLIFFVFHSRLVIGTWVWDLAHAPLIIAQYAMAGVWNWLVGGIVLHYTCRWFGARQPSFAELDIAVFCLWVTWAVMPLFDLPHLFGVPTMPLVAHAPWRHFLLGHLSVLLTSPVRAVLLYHLLRALGRMPPARALGLAVLLAFGARFLVEPSGAFFFLTMEHFFGWTVPFWMGQYHLIGHLLIYTVFWRAWLTGRSWPRAAIQTGWVTALVAVLTLGAVHPSWAALMPKSRPAPRILPLMTASGAASVEPPGVGTWVWTPPTPLQLPVLWDGADHEQVVRVALSPPAAGAVSCEAQVQARDGLPRDGHPWVVCAPTALRDAVEVRVGLHGGGDYTDPDQVELLGVRVRPAEGSA